MILRLFEFIRSLLDRVGRNEMLLFLPVLILVAGSWMFVKIASEVSEGETQHFDSWLVRSMRRADDPSIPIGPEWLAEAGRDVTALGGIALLVLTIGAVAGFLLLQGKYHAMWLTLFASVSGLTISLLLKNFFSRERPTEVPYLAHTMTSSFPSGHSMLSAVVYLTLGILLTRVVDGRLTKVYFLFLAIVLTFLVGVSRVYLGVHYPSDVLAGWTAGLMWALFCWALTRYLQQRGQVESPSESK